MERPDKTFRLRLLPENMDAYVIEKTRHHHKTDTSFAAIGVCDIILCIVSTSCY